MSQLREGFPDGNSIPNTIEWENVQTDRDGLLNISRYRKNRWPINLTTILWIMFGYVLK
jgi:hypothetical protein